MTPVGICQAETSTFSYDFTRLTTLPDGWTYGAVNNGKTFQPTFNQTKGLCADSQSSTPHWARNYVETTVNLSSLNNFTITFTLWNATQEQNQYNYSNQFYLSAENGYTIYIGNTHANRAEINITNTFTRGQTFKPNTSGTQTQGAPRQTSITKTAKAG